MSEKFKWIEKYAPVGIEIKKHIQIYFALVLGATMHSMIFFLRYMAERSELYTYRAGERVLVEGATIEYFDKIIDGLFTTGDLFSMVLLFAIIGYYLYHYQGSKIMYLMKRLPDKWEVHKRCLTLPIAGSVLLAVWMKFLEMIYYSVYILCTPSQCLPL